MINSHLLITLIRLTACSSLGIFTVSCGTERTSEPTNKDSQRQAVDATLIPTHLTSAQSQQLLGEESFSIKITQNTVFKISTSDSSKLPPDQKCNLEAGMHLAIQSKPSVSDFHWKISIKGNPRGCLFSEGYIHESHGFVPQLSKPGYISPVPGAGISSSWCVCRNIGTSPHIGLDIAKGSGMRSYALSNAYVQSVVFNGGCGWEVTLRDNSGAVWLYRHLNKPSTQRGSRLKMGDFIGVHSSYPTASCGSGPHLHFERLTAGGFKDKAVGKTCQFGYSSCNYNPRTPFIDFVSNSPNSSTSMKPYSEEYTSPTTLSEDSTPVKDSETSDAPLTQCSPYLAKPVPTDLSIEQISQISNDWANAPRLESRLSLSSQDLSPDRNEAETQPEAQLNKAGLNGSKINTHPVLSLSAWLKTENAANEKNTCNPSQSKTGHDALQTCIESWKLYLEATDGTVYRVAVDQSSRAMPIEILPDSGLCISFKTTRRYALVAKLKNGQIRTQIGTAALGE